MADTQVLSLDETTDPIALFQAWLREAEASEPNDPNAASLATADASGAPSVRMVLVKRADAEGFRFFTNTGSQKGRELTENPRAALCFHWKSLRRQVRVAGRVVAVAEDENDAYFHSRSRRSQVGAAVSQQSRPLATRGEMERAVERFAADHTDEIPRPSYWRGFSVQPDWVELWSDGADRLHDRVVWIRTADGWDRTRLWP